LVKHHTYKLHASAAFIALEDIDFESAFEKLCPGDAFCLSGKYHRCAERQEKSKKLITFDIRIVWSEILGFAATQNAGFMLC
jgi:tRNA(His) 5'-end guanylyltransferase